MILVKRSSLQNVVVVPKNFRKAIMEEAHRDGHGGVVKMINYVKKKAY